MRAAKAARALGPGARVLGRLLEGIGIDKLSVLVEAGELALPLFGEFDFTCETVLPTRRHGTIEEAASLLRLKLDAISVFHPSVLRVSRWASERSGKC